jgi:hypothetical protein
LPPGRGGTRSVTNARLPEKTTKTWSERLRERSHALIVIRDAVIALIVFVGLSGVAWALAFPDTG